MPGENFKLTCKNTLNNNVQFSVGGVDLFRCTVAVNLCFPIQTVPGFDASMNNSQPVNEFYLSVTNFSTSQCGLYICKDVTTFEEAFVEIPYIGNKFYFPSTYKAYYIDGHPTCILK